MAKIALCLSGQPRCVKQGYEYHKKNLLDHYDVDVFCHVWDSPGIEDVSVYAPVAAMIEKPLTNDLSKYTRVPPPQPNWKVKDPARAAWNLTYSLMKANELKIINEEETITSYDWVIRSRYDFALNVVIPFAELDNTKLYVPNCRMTPQRDFGNDQFAFSSSKNMDKYADCFNQIEKFYDRGTIMIGEEMMAENWREKGLVGENLVYFNPNHPFPPGPHNGTWHSLLREDFESWQK
jgi:hypothetical protein